MLKKRKNPESGSVKTWNALNEYKKTKHHHFLHHTAANWFIFLNSFKNKKKAKCTVPPPPKKKAHQVNFSFFLMNFSSDLFASAHFFEMSIVNIRSAQHFPVPSSIFFHKKVSRVYGRYLGNNVKRICRWFQSKKGIIINYLYWKLCLPFSWIYFKQNWFCCRKKLFLTTTILCHIVGESIVQFR